MVQNARKKLTSLLCVALVALGIGAIGAATPQAALADDGIMTISNTSNSWFHFNLGNGYSSTAATESRAKEDTTPLFFWPQTMTMDMCYIYAEGWHSYGWVDYTVGGHGAIYSADRAYSLKSNVYEYGCRSARITAWQCSQPGYIEGYWSPDSTRTYYICNAGY